MTRERERFQLEPSPIGGGAFGLVYVAFDRELDRRVAIKVPHDEEKERALKNEARLMARIQELHEHHVVALYDLHVMNSRRVIVMEYVEGESLRARIGKIGEQRPLDAEFAVGVAMQACLGLHTLHNAFRDAGLFHRDIKPENILIRRSDGLVKIADFGIATVLEASGLASTTAGTLPYMAPEMLEGEGADCRADVYGLGVTLYEMLTGELPFNPLESSGRAKAPMVFGREICRGDPRAPADVADVNAELSEIVLRAIHRDPWQRYQSAQELRRALEAFHSRLSVDNAVAAAWQEEDPAARERGLQAVLRRFPRNPKGFRNLAWLYNGQLRFQEALKALEEGRVRCPDCGELLVDLALAYFQTRHVRRAVETLEQARRLGLPPDVAKRTESLLKSWGKKA